jgi:hypothetical protein
MSRFAPRSVLDELRTKRPTTQPPTQQRISYSPRSHHIIYLPWQRYINEVMSALDHEVYIHCTWVYACAARSRQDCRDAQHRDLYKTQSRDWWTPMRFSMERIT